MIEEVRLADLVERSLPADRRDALRVVSPVGGPVVRVDKRRMGRVVANLVDNADRHGDGLAAVTVDVVDGQARVIVDDASFATITWPR